MALGDFSVSTSVGALPGVTGFSGVGVGPASSGEAHGLTVYWTKFKPGSCDNRWTLRRMQRACKRTAKEYGCMNWSLTAVPTLLGECRYDCSCMDDLSGDDSAILETEDIAI